MGWNTESFAFVFVFVFAFVFALASCIQLAIQAARSRTGLWPFSSRIQFQGIVHSAIGGHPESVPTCTFVTTCLTRDRYVYVNGKCGCLGASPGFSGLPEIDFYDLF